MTLASSNGEQNTYDLVVWESFSFLNAVQALECVIAVPLLLFSLG